MNSEPKRGKVPVGVIGLGDLGKKLVTQLLCSDCEVVAFDPMLTELDAETLNQAVDPALNINSSSTKSFRLVSVSEVLSICKIVHWAVPSSKLSELPSVSQDCMVILHDSVMANSKAAIRQRNDRDQFVLAHCLMNAVKRVFVDSEIGNNVAAIEHLEEIGLSPKQTTTKAHDVLMARTQGVFALLIDLGIRTELDKGFAEGDLTTSAIELRSAVTNREANWTSQTLQSILSNPELEPFVSEMADIVAKTV